jgi:hypothetical protein
MARNRWYFFVLLFFLVVTIFVGLPRSSSKAFAEDSILIGIDGSLCDAGKESNPYAISTKEDLILFSNYISNNTNYLDKFYKLTSNIILNDGTFDSVGNFSSNDGSDVYSWTPIGTKDNKFCGTFDGDGHYISGLYINGSESWIGFFGYVEFATICNLGMVNGFVSGKKYSSSIAGYAKDSKILNCYNDCQIDGLLFSGGVAGYIVQSDSTSIIANCYSIGSIYNVVNNGAIAGYANIDDVASNNYYLKVNDGINSNMNDIGWVNSSCSTEDISTDTYFESSSDTITIGVNNIIEDRTIVETLNAGAVYYSDEFAIDLSTWYVNDSYPNFEQVISEYTVTYDYWTNGGSEATKLSETLTESAEIDLTVDATKYLWTFLGWNIDSNATIGLESIFMETEDITLYAIYSKTIIATFIDRIDTITKEVTIYNNATEGNISTPSLDEYTNWNSLGWREDTVAENLQYYGNEVLEISNDITYYGIYSKIITLSYYNYNGASVPNNQTQTQYYNAYGIVSECNFTLSDEILREGYEFLNWTCGETNYEALANITIIDDAVMFASWQAKGDTTYYVKHYKESSKVDEYCSEPFQTDALSGTTEQQTLAYSMDIEGFTAKEFTQSTINSDGSTVVNIYYERNSYNVIFKIKANDDISYSSSILKYGSQLTMPSENPTLEGYTFNYWENVPSTMPSCELIITANWKANEDTKYYVNHYLESFEYDIYFSLPYEIETLQGTTEEATTATAKEYDGFSVNNFAQNIIESDGSTEINIYYGRNSYSITYRSKISDTEAFDVKVFKYGAEIIEPTEEPSLVGFTFNGWDNVYNEMPSYDLEIIAYWQANSDTQYKVNHYLESFEDDIYSSLPYEIETLQGTTEETTKVIAKEYEGFSVNELKQNTIESDGSTIINVYYKRNAYNIVFKGQASDTEAFYIKTFQYGEVIVEPTEEPILEGYIFNGWDNIYNEMPSCDLEIIAYWQEMIVNIDEIEDGEEDELQEEQIEEEIETEETIVEEQIEENIETEAQIIVEQEEIEMDEMIEEEQIDEINSISIYDNKVIINEQLLNNETIMINIADYKFSLDNNVIENIKNRMEDREIILSAGTVDPLLLNESDIKLIGDKIVYNFNLFLGEEEIHELNGSVQIALPYTLKEGENADTICVWYLADGNLTKMENVVYEDGTVIFEVVHFSYYVIGSDENDTISGEFIAGIVACIIFIIGTLYFAIVIISKKSKYKNEEIC